MASYATRPPHVLVPGDIRERLDAAVQTGRQAILALVPEYAKISLAVDCWSSPNKLAFMAMTG